MEDLILGKKADRKKLRKYECHVCGQRFRQYVGIMGVKGKHSNVSSQVRCPRCKNFMPTF